ncbi:tRNA N6-adenosine threonylcarbamoyltransferase, mitochondrial [Neocloeon triangulifer]|uniref:tRNA N6-adenosine threonylcarbamoyltransferase, mitochondrial n=1 Tax=Neocloeon triangulifer TaxID=2078957 RepID=UPI00286FA490|nr:tRNA N6-adenosine threonylcarbamoyltransferase, mitochondrial [Neocloeon triangulifer]
MLRRLFSRCLLTHANLKYPGGKWSRRNTSSQSKFMILGIETSCDDTGCAIVDSDGNILGESLHSQLKVHLDHGGIVPPVASDMHRGHIDKVVEEAISAANIDINDIAAIATTNRPGMPLSLDIGVRKGKKMAREHGLPFIPIHHMEAHALTIRMIEKDVEFPFLVLLASGGHCILAIAQSVDKFLLLGQTINNAPGEQLDKAARSMNLRLIPGLENVCGGAAVEIMASRGLSNAFQFSPSMTAYRDCNFSFAGIHMNLIGHIKKLKKKHELSEDDFLPGLEDLCASYQHAFTVHICQRLQRAFEFINRKNLIPVRDGLRPFVVSGGVASNKYMKMAMGVVCSEYDYKLFAPPPHLCTDNGVMIAWNGVERWRTQSGIADKLDDVDFYGKCPLGVDISQEVTDEDIKCKWIKLNNLKLKSEFLYWD